MAKYGMIIDLNQCIRCRACMVGCKIQNDVPPFQQGRVEHYRIRPVEWEEGAFPNVRRIFIPILCMHCDEPECLEACPAEPKAISKRADGLVVVDKDKCVACGSCAEACPYGVPYLLEKADKCDFCAAQRLDKKEKDPACVHGCPGDALLFGDMDNPSSEVSKLVASGKAKPLCPEWGTNPNVYYIPPKWYEQEWPKLSKNKLFLEALAERAKDLAEPKNAALEKTLAAFKSAGALGSPLGTLFMGVVGAGISLDYFARRKQKVSEKEGRSPHKS